MMIGKIFIHIFQILLVFFKKFVIIASIDGKVAEWSCSGLQLRVRRFDSDLSLHLIILGW